MIWFINGVERTFEHYLYLLDPDQVSFYGNPLLAGWDVQGLMQSHMGWDNTDFNSCSITTNQFVRCQDDIKADANVEISDVCYCFILIYQNCIIYIYVRYKNVN